MSPEEEKTGSTEQVSTPGESPRPDGSGPDGSGPDGSGPDGSGPDGSGPDGSGPDGSGPDGSGPSEEELLQVRLREQLEQVPEWVQPLDSRALRRRVKQQVERISKRFGIRQILRLTVYQPRVQTTLEEVPKRMQLVTNQAKLVLELIEDFVQGRYRDIPWHSVAVAAAALVYSVSPTDVLPDFIPVVGALDDMVVLSLAMRVVQKDLRAYCEFKGYAVSEYFETRS